MKREDIILAAGVAGLGASAWLAVRSRGSASRALPLSGRQRILVIGDSLAAGMMPSFKRLAERDGHSFFGSGCPMRSPGGPSCTAVVGSSTVQWSKDAWLEPTLSAASPTVVLISLGANDYQSGTAQAQKIREAAQKIADRIRSIGATSVWIEPLAMPFADSSGAAESWRQSASFVVPIGDFNLPRAPDRIHLSPSGYQAWAERIWSQLSER